MQESNYEIVVFMPPERAEDMAQINLGVHILRLGNWDDDSSVRTVWNFHIFKRHSSLWSSTSRLGQHRT